MKLLCFPCLALGLEHTCEAEYHQGHNDIALFKNALTITNVIIYEIWLIIMYPDLEWMTK
jgi:hypothetical protein